MKKKSQVQRHIVVNSASWMADLPVDVLWRQEEFLRTLMSEKLPMWFAPLFMRFAEYFYKPTSYSTHIYHNLRVPGRRMWFLSLHGLGSMDMLKVLNVTLVNTKGDMPPRHEKAIVYSPTSSDEPFKMEVEKWCGGAGPDERKWYSHGAAMRRFLYALFRTGVEMWLEPSDVKGAFTVWMYHDRSLIRMDFQSQAGQVWGSH